MKSPARVLFVCPPGPAREQLLELVDRTGDRHVVTPSVSEAEKALKDAYFDFIITARNLGDGDFGRVLRAAELHRKYIPVVVVSHTADWDEFIDAIDRGAFDLLAAGDVRADGAKRVLDNALLASRARTHG